MASTKDKIGLLSVTAAPITPTGVAMHSDGMAGSDGDLLFGAAAITEFVNQLSATRINRRQIYHWLEVGHLPSGKLGTKVVGSKCIIREHFAKLTSGAASPSDDPVFVRGTEAAESRAANIARARSPKYPRRSSRPR
jgi:hypothetical protein